MDVATKQMFHVGDRAIYDFGGTDIEVEVIEERGPLGVNGRYIVRIRVPITGTDPMEISVAEARLRPISRSE